MDAQLTVGGALLNSARKYPQKTAIVFEDRRFTFDEFNMRVNRLAHALLGLGLAKGDRVAVLLGNCNEIVELLMAAAKTGLVAVPVNFRFVPSEIEYVVNQSQSKALIVGEDYLSKVESARPNFQTVDRYISVAAHPVAGMLDYEQLLAASSPAEPAIEVHENDPWYIGYTSGTTGLPKGALISHRARILPALFMIIEFGLRDTDAELMTMPMFHTNGIQFSMIGLYLGNTVFIMRNFEPETVLRAIAEHKLTYASLVPTMYAMILGLPQETKARYGVGSMRVLISSSSPLLTKTKEEILSFFSSSELNEFYGSSEAGIITNLKPRDQMRKIRCVGQAMFGIEIKLLDADGAEVAPGEVGELYSKGPCFTEYYRMPEVNAFRDGWFSAGDMARMDEEGYYYIVDRKKDMIISGGENIYPVEVEELLSRHPAVSEVAVIGIPHEKWGESVHAVIVTKGPAQASEQAIIDYCKGRIASYKGPRSVEFVEALPKNPTGKVLKRVLRDRRWSGQEAKI
jgi:long-chain acyl-CoA synthetase